MFSRVVRHCQSAAAGFAGADGVFSPVTRQDENQIALTHILTMWAI